MGALSTQRENLLSKFGYIFTFEQNSMPLEFASDAHAIKFNLKTEDLFSGNTTDFHVGPQSKALININIRTGNIFTNNKTTIGR